MFLLLSSFLQAQNRLSTKSHSCMDETTPSLYNWKEVETKFTKRLHITPYESKSFFRYAAKLKYLKIEEYRNLVKEGAITKANAQQYWIDKLPYFEEVYKFKYLPAIALEKEESEKRGAELKNGAVNKTASASCSNLDFSSGTLTNWVGQWNNFAPNNGVGGNNAYGTINTNGFNTTPSGYNDQGYVHEICTGGMDRNVPVNTVPPGHSFSLRLGDDSAYVENLSSAKFPYNHQTISNTFSVTSASETITYWYAVALTQSSQSAHPENIQPFFKIRMYDQTGAEITCARYDVDGTTSFFIGGFDSIHDGLGNTLIYKDWSQVLIPLTPYLGQTVKLTFETSDCGGGGHFGYAYVAADCAPLAVITAPPQPCINGNTILTAPAGLQTYSWTGPGIVGVNTSAYTSQTATANVGGTYSVTMTTFANPGQTGCALTLTANVVGSTASPIASFSATTPCLNNTTQFTDESTLLPNQGTLTNWNWDFGDGVTSASNNPTHTYATAGTFPVTYTIVSSVNCSATYSTTVTVNPLPTSSFIADTVCKQLVTTFTNTSTGGATYNWNFGDGSGTSTAQSPTYIYVNSGVFAATLTVTNAFSCKAVSTTNVEVDANAIVSYSSPNICLGTNSVFNNTSTPTTNVAYSWNFGDVTNPGDTSNLQNPTYLYPDTGKFTIDLTITSTSGCVSSKTITLNVKPIPQVAVTSPAPFCWNDIVSSPSFTPTPNASVTYAWANNNTAIGLLQSNGGPNAPPTFTAGINYTGANILGVITVTPSLNGCSGTPQSYTVTVKPTPTVTHSNVAYCPHAVAPADTITAVPTNATIAWSTVNTNPNIGLPVSSGGSIIPSFTASGSPALAQSNIINVTVSLNGCVGPSSSFSITVDPYPIARFTYSGACDGNSTQFLDESTSGGSPITQWHWDFFGEGTSTLKNPSFLFGPAGKTFSVTLQVTTTAGCTNTVTESVYINPSAQTNFFADSVSCTPLKTIFNDIIYNSVPVKTWTWDFGNTAVATYTNNTVVQQTYTNGSHVQNSYFSVTLTVVTDSNCISTVTKTNYITVYPKPLAGFAWNPKDVDILQPIVYFQNQSIGASGINAYNWSFGDIYETVDSLSYSSIANPQHTYSDQVPGTYTVTQVVENVYGCMDSIKEVVVIKEAVTFYIPNAFTPNNDDINNGFKGLGIGIDNSTYNLWVFDRWGLLIFHGTDIDKSWDGTYKGGKCQEDVYVWKVSFYDDFNKKHDYHGTVTLLR